MQQLELESRLWSATVTQGSRGNMLQCRSQLSETLGFVTPYIFYRDEKIHCSAISLQIRSWTIFQCFVCRISRAVTTRRYLLINWNGLKFGRVLSNSKSFLGLEICFQVIGTAFAGNAYLVSTLINYLADCQPSATFSFSSFLFNLPIMCFRIQPP